MDTLNMNKAGCSCSGYEDGWIGEMDAGDVHKRWLQETVVRRLES
jgi:hypothetical protein